MRATDLFLVLLLAACRTEVPACYEGDFAACTCASNAPGYRHCLVPEETYSACVCDGTTPGVDGSVLDAGEEAEAAPPAKLPFMSKCTVNDECESGNCHVFAQEGSFCTHECKDTVDCPAPSSGCNQRGICKAP
jgi:hypothetical protein